MAQIIIRLTLSSNANGPFNIYTGSTSTTPIRVNQTSDQIAAGVVLDLTGFTTGTEYTIFVVNKQPGCNDDTISKKFTVFGDILPSPSVTPTSSITPTPSITPTI